MDAIRKKMQSLRDETDQYLDVVAKMEESIKESDTISRKVGVLIIYLV